MRNNGTIAGVVVAILALLIGGYLLFFRGTTPDTTSAPAAVETPQGQTEDVVVDKSVPTFDIVRVERDGSAMAAGRALAGAKIEVLANGKTASSATADTNGEWVAVFDKPLAPGEYQITLRATSPDGSVKTSTQSVAVSVPAQAGAPALVVLSEAGKASRVLQGPGVPADAGNLVLESVDYDEKGNLIISGKADAGAHVRIYVGGNPVGDATANAQGHWELRPTVAIAPGKYTMRIDQVDAGGKVVARIELPFERGEPGEVVAALKKGQVVIQPGNNLWGIAQQIYGSGFRYTVIYEANKGQIRDPNLIYPGQIFATPQQ
ncbi:MAG: Ig-like domain-containing protein [Parvibaculaceae bacterium]